MLAIPRLKSFWGCLCLFVFPIITMLFLTPFLTSPITRYLLQEKAQEVITHTEERNNLLEHNIVSQLPKIKFNCGLGDIELLRNPSYYNSHIRFAGIKTSGGKSCSTLGTGLPISDAIKDMPSKADYIISTTPGATGIEQEFVVYSKRGGNLIYWVINNSFVHDLLLRPCKNCFYLEYTYNDPRFNEINIPRGDVKIKHQNQAISISHLDSLRKVEQKIWAGEKFRNYVTHLIRYYGLFFSSVVGLLLVTAYLLLRNHNNSLGGMLKSALKKNEFIPYYQPIVDSRTQQVVGYEALIRWRRGGELIPPGIFIDYAERQGLIIPITTQLVSKIVADLHKFYGMQWVSINLVAAHVEQPYLQDLLKKLQWPDPKKLTFELTERIPISDVKAATREIATLGLRGYHFKLDDFGTGYGGFAYLQQLGIRCIKIDKMFIDTIGTTDLKRNVLDAIIAFGRESNMEMIAEGVETDEQLEYLHKQGVYLIQGYVYAKPMPINQLIEWELSFKGKQLK
ncbi:diguanylate phosphodiesterase [Aeromonas sp. DNP9]|nr:EAL domain-containing protein [Aeromonas sp. DNP9]OEC38110.1 diguanylate phosphodiesterase [Aeromonas sp. DNP9]